MRRKINWEGQIGRRLRFRDLHVFYGREHRQHDKGRDGARRVRRRCRR